MLFRALPLLLACCVAGAQPLPGSTSRHAAPADDSLYQAFGQKDGLRALMLDFKVRLLADPRLHPFFKDSDGERLVSQLTDQLCQETGGPCVYRGGAMKPIHAGMEIRREDFNALVEVLQDAMRARGIPFAAQNRLLARLAPMHRDIVNR